MGFATKKLKKIELENGEYIKIRESLSFKETQELGKNTEDENEVGYNMILLCLKEWNFKNENGEIPEINKETIGKLDLKTLNIINKEIAEIVKIEEKKSNKKK